MLPDLRQTTLALIREAERVSGYPVEVQPDPGLSLPASLAMARGQTPFHTITFNPRVIGEPDYVVCVQCAFILRHFAPKPDARVDLGSSERGRTTTGELVQRMIQQGRMPLPVEQADTFAAHLLGGLGTQLRSIPVQLRVDDWLGREHPELRDAQVTDVRRQLLNDEKALKAQGQVPAKIVRASLSMNAAAALYWAGALADDTIAAPYRQTGFSMAGRGLLKAWHRIDAEPTSDRTLIDAWAHELGIAGWFDWVPYADPARSAARTGGVDA